VVDRRHLDPSKQRVGEIGDLLQRRVDPCLYLSSQPGSRENGQRKRGFEGRGKLAYDLVDALVVSSP